MTSQCIMFLKKHRFFDHNLILSNKIITYKFRFAVFWSNFWKFIMDTVREIPTALKTHYAL